MPPEVVQFLQALLNAFQSFAENAVDEESIQLFENVVQWSAILLSALAGTYAARKFGMDYFGALVIAFVASVGGGTIRDLLLGRFPIFWLDNSVHSVTVMIVSILGMFVQQGARKGERLAEHVAKPIEKILSEGSPLLLVVDSLALGLWAYLGTSMRWLEACRQSWPLSRV